ALRDVENLILTHVHGRLGERGVTRLRKNPGEIGRTPLVTNTAAEAGDRVVGLSQGQLSWNVHLTAGRIFAGVEHGERIDPLARRRAGRATIGWLVRVRG